MRRFSGFGEQDSVPIATSAQQSSPASTENTKGKKRRKEIKD
jgi:hypothetical protein